MIGALIGDTVGSVYEFNNISTKDFPLFDKECFLTDDSILTLAIAEIIQNNWQNDKNLTAITNTSMDLIDYANRELDIKCPAANMLRGFHFEGAVVK